MPLALFGFGQSLYKDFERSAHLIIIVFAVIALIALIVGSNFTKK